jgi:ribosomal-protein-serine acetyltransferase
MIDIINVAKDLYLRRITHQDAEEVFDLIDRNRQHLRTWLPFVDTTYTANNTHAFIEQLQKPYCREMVFTICYQGAITGLIGFKDIDQPNHRLEIGYWISSANQGKGIVTNVCRAVIAKAFTRLKMNRIQIKCGVGNERSRNVPKRLGFTFEGIERAGEKHRNSFIDLEVYSLLKADWLALK